MPDFEETRVNKYHKSVEMLLKILYVPVPIFNIKGLFKIYNES